MNPSMGQSDDEVRTLMIQSFFNDWIHQLKTKLMGPLGNSSDPNSNMQMYSQKPTVFQGFYELAQQLLKSKSIGLIQNGDCDTDSDCVSSVSQGPC
jgi:hypothetical protein